MTDERNYVKEYNGWMEARVAAGMPAIERSMVTLGQSFVWISPEGIKTIEWSDMQDPTKWEPINEITP
jgi:hypothetical protein